MKKNETKKKLGEIVIKTEVLGDGRVKIIIYTKWDEEIKEAIKRRLYKCYWEDFLKYGAEKEECYKKGMDYEFSDVMEREEAEEIIKILKERKKELRGMAEKVKIELEKTKQKFDNKTFVIKI